MLFGRKGILKNQKKTKKGLKSLDSLSIENVESQLNHTEDLKKREIHINNQIYVILYINSLTDQEKLESKVIEPLTKTVVADDIVGQLYSQEIQSVSTTGQAVDGLLIGQCLLLKKEGPEEGLLLKVDASVNRDITEPVAEKALLGSHTAFVEDLDKNIFSVRKYVVTPDFTVKKYTLGTETTTDVAIVYVDHLVNQETIKKVDQRLKSISLDSIRSSGDIQDCIEDHVFSPFPQILVTERPDRTASNLKDGKVGIVINGSSSVFILPATFKVFFQSPDDYVSRWALGSFLRFLRLISYIMALFLPAIYIAVISYHYEILPTELVYSMQGSLSYVPFSPIIELMAMQLFLELLREASVRLPPSIASTFGIVGGIVIGTAMVEAGLVSYGGLIIIAITAVSSFVQPNLEMSSTIRFLGLPLMILAALFGFLGIILGVLLILIHLTRLTSFGSPYFSPFAPLNLQKMKDMVIRAPVWAQEQHSKASSQSKKANKSREWKSHESEEPY